MHVNFHWRDLPPYFGKSNTVYKAYQRYHFILSDGTNHDVKVAPDLIDKIGLRNTDILCADKGYDSDPLRAHNEQAGCINNIL